MTFQNSTFADIERMDRILFRLVKYIKPYKWIAVASVIFVLLANAMQLVTPTLTEKMINLGIRVADTQAILRIGGTMLALSALNIVISVLNTYFSSKTASGYSNELRKVVFRKVQTLSQSNMDKLTVASLITRSSNDITQVQQMIITVMQQLISVPILFVGGLVMAISKSRELSKIILIIVPFILLLVVIILILFMPMFKKMQKMVDKLNQIIREKIGGIRVIRAFNRSDYEDGRFRKANFDLTSISLKVQRIFALMLPVAIIFAFALIAYLFAYTGRQADAMNPAIKAERIALGDTIGTLTAFVSYLVLVIGAVSMAAALVAVIPKASISANRILEVLDMETDVKEPEAPVHQEPDKRGWVEFRDVGFTYPEKDKKPKKKHGRLYTMFFTDEEVEKKKKKQSEAPAAEAAPEKETPAAQTAPAAAQTDETEQPAAPAQKEKKEKISIKHVSFLSKPGEVTAILGGTGSGKSTLVSLIPRLYDVLEGEISVGGVNVKEQAAAELNASIAYIPQKAFLFSGTIADNLRYGKPDATDEEMDRALEIAQAKVFVDRMPEGKESMISQSGTNVSGGQRQRLAIARAVIKKADICIFDDSFSALDLATDAKLRAAIKKELTDTNIIIVAQRIGTVLDADRIIVLDNGKVAGIGKHHELMESCEIYREMVASQLTPEEVAAI